LIKGDAKKRTGAGGRQLRETSKIPSRYFVENDGKFTEFDLDAIKALESCVPGIYELAIAKATKRKNITTTSLDLTERDLIVVYVGMSTNLKERMKDHYYGDRVVDGMRRTSNIAREIADARRQKYTIYFRVSKYHDTLAKETESSLLDGYDYAWNLEENGKVKRFIF